MKLIVDNITLTLTGLIIKVNMILGPWKVASPVIHLNLE